MCVPTEESVELSSFPTEGRSFIHWGGAHHLTHQSRLSLIIRITKVLRSNILFSWLQVLVQLSQPSSRYQINSLKCSDQALGSWRFLLGKEGFPIKKQVEFKHQVVLSSHQVVPFSGNAVLKSRIINSSIKSSLSSGPVLRQRGL